MQADEDVLSKRRGCLGHQRVHGLGQRVVLVGDRVTRVVRGGAHLEVAPAEGHVGMVVVFIAQDGDALCTPGGLGHVIEGP